MKEEVLRYEFSLFSLLRKCKHDWVHTGLLFQCQVATNGLSKLQSVPKSFSEFVLLAPPMDLQVTTPPRRPGLCIGWEYSTHAIGYRVELVIENTEDIVFSKVVKCEKGSHGESFLRKEDFKNIPQTESGKGYQLRMYSLGFGQELIRCLHPSIAAGIFHVIPTELQYLKDLDVVRVKVTPFTNAKSDYVVQLCRVTGDDEDEPLPLTAKYIYNHEIHGKVNFLTDISLKKWWHLLQSGDLIIAWVHSTSKNNCDITYIGAAQNEVCVLNSPTLTTIQNYNSDWTVSRIKLTWSEVNKAQQYQYGYFLPMTNEYIAIKETQENEAIMDFRSWPLQNIYHCFQIYVAAQGKHGMYLVGELSIDSSIIQSITSDLQGMITFTSFSLQQMWRKYLTDHSFSNYYAPVLKCQQVLFPSGIPFPSLNIPKKFRQEFWKSESPLFESCKSYGTSNCMSLS